MMIITSLSPSHSNAANQQAALKSWQQHGKCFSLNNKYEKKLIEAEYEGINILETSRTVDNLYGNTPRVSINAIIDIAKVQMEDLFLINSDIVISHLPEFKTDGITIFSRYDYTDNIEQNDMFIFGFDAVYIPFKYLNIYPPSIYALGASWWDFWVPYRAILNNIPVYYPFGKYLFHKRHDVQYSTDEWYYIGKAFRWEFKFNESMMIEHLATMIMAQIKHKLIQ